ncbi:hypothetical protein SK128_020501 [Halocaridina rubra]|uniref:Ku70/Ku80 N-terminal alpha/beta domain-containing protein n=1 Tax=Halocaridina rubra TaxID=373956 RepID=A0AAN8XMX7_HALRR
MPPRAKPGEGIVVVLDVGPGVRAGTDTTFFAQSKKCLINILQRKMYAEKCRDMVGLVLCGSNETDNALATDNQYRNIKLLQPPLTVTWDIINRVENISGGRESGDWLDALVVAMDLLHDPDGIRFSNKRIILMTDFSGEFSDDQTTQIIAGLKNHEIELSVM